MPNTTVYTNNQYYQDIAAAIRSKNGTETTYKPSEMAPAINALVVSGESIDLQAKTVNPTVLTQTVFADTGYNGLSQVTVNAIQTEARTVTQNGVITPTEGSFFSSVNVAVIDPDIHLQSKIAIPTESEQTIEADEGYQGLGTVTIDAIPSDYVGSAINTYTTLSEGIVSSVWTYSGTGIPSISHSVGIETGYYDINNTSAGLNTRMTDIAHLPTASGYTYVPRTATYTAVSGNTWLTGAIKVGAVPLDSNNTFSANGTYSSTSGKWFNKVTVAVPSDIHNQNKSVDPTESVQTISADSGYSGLGTVTVNFIPNNYVGSAVERRNAMDLTVNGSYITAPAGYYAASASKSVQVVAQATPSISIDSNGVIVATATQIAGYVAAGSKTASSPMTTKSGVTIVPATTSQTAVERNVYTLGEVIVGPVPTETVTLTSNGSHSATAGKFWSDVTVAVPSDIRNQNKTVTSSTATQTISADSGYSGLGTVTINAIATATQATPSISVNASGLISATATQAAGYVTAGTKTSTSQLSVQSGTTITPTETKQTAVASGKYTTGTVTVAAIPSDYVGSGVTTRSSADLNVSGPTITAPAGYYASTATATVSSATQATPTITVSTDGKITATVTQAAGYVSAGTKTATSQLSVQSGTTITPSTATQTAVASGKYTTGTITVAAIQTETKTATQNGDVTPSTGKYLTKVTVAVPSDINNETAKTITPSTATQTVTPGSGYSGLSKVTVNPIPSNYITTSDATATASQILATKTAYVNGSKVTGTMTNNGATGTTLTSQGATYTIPAGYTSGGTVTASLPVSTISNNVLNVETVTEATNDYGVRASITIPAGYYNATTLSKVLSTVLPAPASAITQSQMLSGYEAYNNEGQLLVGTMTNRNDWGATLDQTTTSVTIPEGYHDGTGTVSHATVNIPDPTFSIVNSTGVITASGTWTRGFTTDNSYSKTYSLTTQAGTTITPTESAQTAVAAYRWTTGTITVGAIPSDYVGSGITTRTSLAVNANTVTASAGYYPNAITTTIAAMTLPTSAVTTSAGTAKATITRSTATRYINIPVGYNSTAAHYVISAVANGTVVPPTTITGSQATVTPGTNILTLSKTISVTPNVITAGYISAGTASNVTVTLSAAVTTKAAATITPGTSTTTIAAGTYLTGAQTIVGDADLTAANIKTGVQIFGVNGNFTADATATASEIISTKTAYVNGNKITGNLVVNKYYTGTSAPASNLGNNGDIYFQGGDL